MVEILTCSLSRRTIARCGSLSSSSLSLCCFASATAAGTTAAVAFDCDFFESCFLLSPPFCLLKTKCKDITKIEHNIDLRTLCFFDFFFDFLSDDDDEDEDELLDDEDEDELDFFDFSFLAFG